MRTYIIRALTQSFYSPSSRTPRVVIQKVFEVGMVEELVETKGRKVLNDSSNRFIFFSFTGQSSSEPYAQWGS